MSKSPSRDSDEPLIDVPEDFDGFDKARRKRSTTPDHERHQCPDCGSVDIARKCRGEVGPQRKDGDWRCQSCGGHFDAPEDAMPREQRSLADFGGRP